MIRRLFVWSCLLLSLLVVWCPQVWAQCHGYSANVQYTALSPADAAQSGQVTATITEQASNVSGAVPSHNFTGTPGTLIQNNWSSNNGVSATAYFTWDNDPTKYYYNISLNGSSVAWLLTADEIGHIRHIVFVVTGANGSTTQDRMDLSVVTGNGPSIVSQDGMFTNVYVQVSIPFGGPSMATACDICVQAEYKCNGAVHTPYVTMSAVNQTSGDSQSLPRQLAGNPASQYQSISGNGSIMISALPNDTINGTANAEILCSMLGDLPMQGNDDFVVQIEWAWTKVSTIQNTCVSVNNGVQCNVTSKYTTSTACQPPDLNPATVFSDFPVAGMPITPATMPPFWWTFGVGLRPRITNWPWWFPASDLRAILQEKYFILDILAGAFPSNSTVRDATNYDKGCGVPSPFPPFDQP